MSDETFIPWGGKRITLSEWQLMRADAIDSMARQYLAEPSSLVVAKRRRDGSVISWRKGKLHVRCEHVLARAFALKAAGSR